MHPWAVTAVLLDALRCKYYGIWSVLDNWGYQKLILVTFSEGMEGPVSSSRDGCDGVTRVTRPVMSVCGPGPGAGLARGGWGGHKTLGISWPLIGQSGQYWPLIGQHGHMSRCDNNEEEALIRLPGHHAQDISITG